MADDTEVKLSKGQTFVRRLCSTLFLYGVLMAGLFAPNEKVKLVAFGGIMALLGAVALMEYFHMARKRDLAPFAKIEPQLSPAFAAGRISASCRRAARRVRPGRLLPTRRHFHRIE